MKNDKVAARPHPTTVHQYFLSTVISLLALTIAGISLWTSRTAMKVSQRAYLTYQIAVSNPTEVNQAFHQDKDFFLNFQVTVTNMGNTPADSIFTKINVVPDPDRTPVMITFPSGQPFDLGPKESHVLSGQALFKHLHNVRHIAGFSSGFTGEIEYKDVFGDSQAKQTCYQFLIDGDSISTGVCGSVMQVLQIK